MQIYQQATFKNKMMKYELCLPVDEVDQWHCQELLLCWKWMTVYQHARFSSLQVQSVSQMPVGGGSWQI